MDGTRMGSRSSTRHGPAAVFSGPVRRWRKVWAPVSSSSSSASTSSASSRVLLYKWVPVTPSGGREEAPDEPTPPIVRYMPVSIVLAQRKEASKGEEEVETESQKVEDPSEEPQVQAEGTDLNIVFTESKVSEPIEADVQEHVDNTQDEKVSEILEDKSGIPVAGSDVAMTDAEQMQEEAEMQHEQVSLGLDLENAQVPSDSSAGSEHEH